MKNNPAPHGSVWWRSPYVWLLIAGPVAVILASLVTLFLALSRPDPVVSASYSQVRELTMACSPSVWMMRT